MKWKYSINISNINIYLDLKRNGNLMFRHDLPTAIKINDKDKNIIRNKKIIRYIIYSNLIEENKTPWHNSLLTFTINERLEILQTSYHLFRTIVNTLFSLLFDRKRVRKYQVCTVWITIKIDRNRIKDPKGKMWVKRLVKRTLRVRSGIRFARLNTLLYCTVNSDSFLLMLNKSSSGIL